MMHYPDAGCLNGTRGLLKAASQSRMMLDPGGLQNPPMWRLINVDQIDAIIQEDRRVMVREVSEKVGVSVRSAHKVMHNDLG